MWNFLLRVLRALFRPAMPGDVPEPPPIPPVGQVPTLPKEDEILMVLWEAHNAMRRSGGVQPLSLSERLNVAAKCHATWMATNRNMSHSQKTDSEAFFGVTLSDRLHNVGYPFRSAGENIAAGQRSATQVMTAWLASSGHRANILNDAYWNVGFGVARDLYGNLYWCVVFATPLTSRVIGKEEPVVTTPSALVFRG